MNVRIIDENCIGCGTCYSICPDVFDMGDEGIAIVKKDVDFEEFEDDIKSAIDACPTGAITDDNEEAE